MLWAYQTTKRSSIGETPFAMVYGIEAVIPIEIGMPILCSDIMVSSEINQNQLLLNLDLAEETRQIAQIRLASYQQQARNFYAQRVKSCSFVMGDWVLHRIPTAQMKLQPNWEGPLEIIEVIEVEGDSRRKKNSQDLECSVSEKVLYIAMVYIHR